MKAIGTAVLAAFTILPVMPWHAILGAEPPGRTTTVPRDARFENGNDPAPPNAGDLPRREVAGWRIDGLYNDGARRLLLLDDGRRILFEPVAGDVPDRFVDATGHWLLHGTLGRYRVSEAGGRQAQFVASVRQRVGAPAMPGRQRHPHDCPLDCDSTADDAGPGFTDGPGIPGATRLDVRPASCRSYFVDYPPIDRGTHIEAALTRHPAFASAVPTVRSFPLVDWISDTELIVLHSRDLASRYLDASRDPDALYDRLLADGEAIQRDIVDGLAIDGGILVRESGAQTHLAPDPPRQPVLAMVVRDGLVSPSQLAQIRRAEADLARRHGIELRVIEIP